MEQTRLVASKPSKRYRRGALSIDIRSKTSVKKPVKVDPQTINTCETADLVQLTPLGFLTQERLVDSGDRAVVGTKLDGADLVEHPSVISVHDIEPQPTDARIKINLRRACIRMPGSEQITRVADGECRKTRTHELLGGQRLPRASMD